ncbi:MAG: hypothetical protein AAF806_31795 [Bacteroidota bacterium]
MQRNIAQRMETVEIKSRLQHYINQADQSFLQIVQAMFEQYFEEEKKRQNKREKELLVLINSGLSAKEERRLDELDEKRSLNQLNAEEHTELMELVNQVETFNAQRLQYLSELAQLRKIDIRTLMTSLNLKPRVRA